MWNSLLKKTAPLTHSKPKRPDEMISPYSIIFIPPLQCRNRWPAWLSQSFKFSYNFVALFLFSFFLYSLAYSFWPEREDEKFQCKNVQLDPPLWSMQILFFVLFFFPQFVVQRREKKRPDLEHVRASPVGPVGGEEDEEEKEEKKNRCKTSWSFIPYVSSGAKRNRVVGVYPRDLRDVTRMYPRKKKKKKLIYMIPNGPVLLFTSFLFFSIIIKEEKKREL